MSQGPLLGDGSWKHLRVFSCCIACSLEAPTLFFSTHPAAFLSRFFLKKSSIHNPKIKDLDLYFYVFLKVVLEPSNPGLKLKTAQEA